LPVENFTLKSVTRTKLFIEALQRFVILQKRLEERFSAADFADKTKTISKNLRFSAVE
jgi:hypothetical protein